MPPYKLTNAVLFCIISAPLMRSQNSDNMVTIHSILFLLKTILNILLCSTLVVRCYTPLNFICVGISAGRGQVSSDVWHLMGKY